MCTHTHGTILLRVPLSKEYLLRYGTMVPSVSGSTLKVLNMMGPIGYSNRYKVTHNSWWALAQLIDEVINFSF